MSPREKRSADEPVESFDLCDDGSVVIAFDGTSYRLRRPNIGQFRKLRELLYEVQDAPIHLAAELPPRPEGDDLAELDAWKEANRAAGARIESLRFGWIREVVATLCSTPLPGEDELPVWLGTDSIVTDLLTHWSKAPIRTPE